MREIADKVWWAAPYRPGELKKTLETMELNMDFATAKYSHCCAVNIFPGFMEIMAFTCQSCGSSAMRK
jgi:hypothetical protein